MFAGLQDSDLHLITNWRFVLSGYEEFDFAMLLADLVGWG